MTIERDVARLAALLADPTRAAFCLALLDGRAWTATELAGHAGVAASTASEHLNRLVEGGLLAERRQGRHRYVQLANTQAADLLEAFISHLGPARKPPTGLRAVSASAALANGRTCYDHLAGRLGVTITDAMTAAGLLDQSDGFAITDTGFSWLTGDLGIAEADLRSNRRPLARPCLDWTERRSHLAGTAGAHLLRSFRTNGWIKKIGTGRAVRLTATGTTALRDLLAIDARTAGLA
ncbi:DNA-binding transcriptional regulator, ArsR family [Saccharopolyspora kobensis]|uniref:Transcriptional regulator, ArsR family n=1 Tax=Saccharopolyspora kobensis TaxID=146035 RepID=A0A1H6D5E4_9PSEU|nr:winged helix-turn-helix domain-containing protein [Saccharopolyspora kobensis]SEG80587.1 DNA-binding transcriptional regulator, ArsR family [Saccharopolyspora kobensis]SFD12442.1 transcriptional regulator, ArsR family [Saccharopolyspora kobensis]